MAKKIITVTVLLLLVGLISSGLLGCEKEAENGVVPSGEEAVTPKEEEKTESLTDILGKAKGVASFKYDMVVTSAEGETLTQKMWLKGKKMRMEGTIEGRSMVYLVDADEQLAYIYFPAENTAMKIGLAEAKETAGESPTEQSGSIIQYNPVVVGSEIWDGKSCLVVTYTDKGDKVKTWLWKKYGFPIKIERTTAKGTTVLELKNIELGGISDSMFELPAGVQIMQIPSF